MRFFSFVKILGLKKLISGLSWGKRTNKITYL